MKKVVLVFTAILVLCALPGLSGAARNNHQYDAALKAYYSGHFKKAVADLKEYADKRPDAAAYYLIGYGLYKLRKYEEATEYFDQAYLIDPTFSPEKIGFGKFAAEMKRKPAVRTVKKKAVSKKVVAPKSAATVAAVKPKPVKPEAAATPAKAHASTSPVPAPTSAKPKAPAPARAKAAPKVHASPPHKAASVKPHPHPVSTRAHNRHILGMAPGLLAGVLAGFVLLILALAIVLYRRRANKREEDIEPGPPDFPEDE